MNEHYISVYYIHMNTGYKYNKTHKMRIPCFPSWGKQQGSYEFWPPNWNGLYKLFVLNLSTHLAYTSSLVGITKRKCWWEKCRHELFFIMREKLLMSLSKTFVMIMTFNKNFVMNSERINYIRFSLWWQTKITF